LAVTVRPVTLLHGKQAQSAEGLFLLPPLLDEEVEQSRLRLDRLPVLFFELEHTQPRCPLCGDEPAPLLGGELAVLRHDDPHSVTNTNVTRTTQKKRGGDPKTTTPLRTRSGALLPPTAIVRCMAMKPA